MFALVVGEQNEERQMTISVCRWAGNEWILYDPEAESEAAFCVSLHYKFK